jgi:FlaA1/EpsC-like NDP-sugar epimerase
MSNRIVDWHITLSSESYTRELERCLSRVMKRRARKDAQQILEAKARDLSSPHLSILETAAMDLSKSIDYSTLQGKTALITGAAGGLGRGMAVEWAKNG